MDEITFPFLDVHSLLQISPPFLLIDESCTTCNAYILQYRPPISSQFLLLIVEGCNLQPIGFAPRGKSTIFKV
jgi:hypothetical protein